jgi:sulfofructose kinase
MSLSQDTSANQTPEVIGIGAATLDELWRVSSFQAEESVTEALDRVVMGGGPVATALCCLSRFGHACALLDSCGDDSIGFEIIQSLQAHGVHTAWLQKRPNAMSARAVVLVRETDGARQIHYLPSTAREPEIHNEFIIALSKARLLHLNGRHENAARLAIREAQRAGVTISWDGGAGRYRDSIRDLVEASHLRIVSVDFARKMTGLQDPYQMAEALLLPPARLVVVTAGTSGCYIAIPGEPIFHQPAYPAAHVVDTTGCGDVFHGAFLHGWLCGLSVSECADLAARWAARNAEGLGGRFICHSLKQNNEA